MAKWVILKINVFSTSWVEITRRQWIVDVSLLTHEASLQCISLATLDVFGLIDLPDVFAVNPGEAAFIASVSLGAAYVPSIQISDTSDGFW